jgi:hypothetical protein
MLVYWSGNHERCDICDKRIGTIMYDTRIPPAGGAWACVCPDCFSMQGCRLGTGLGQRYELQEDGRWLKTAG